MLDEARTNVKAFEIRLQKQEKNDENIKDIFKQLQDYLYLSDDENVSLNSEIEKLKNEKQILEKANAEMQTTINEYKKREHELEGKVSKLKGELVEKEEINNCGPTGKCKSYELEIEELKAEKALLEIKLRNYCIAYERSDENVMLTETNTRLSQEIKQTQEKYDRCNDEKFQLENELHKSMNDIQAKECDLADLRKNLKATEEKVEERDREIAALTHKLLLCNRANETAYLEKRKLEEERSNTNTLIAELENKIALQRTTNEKCNEEMKCQKDEISKLEEANKLLKSELGEMENDTRILRTMLNVNKSKKKKTMKKLAAVQEKVQNLEKELEAKNEKLHDMEREITKRDCEAAKGKDEKQALLLKINEANKLISESKMHSERKAAELQSFLEDCNVMGQRVHSLQRDLVKKEEQMETFKREAKQDQEDSLNEIAKLKTALNHYEDANQHSNAQLCSLEEQKDALRKKVEYLESENETLNKMADTIKAQLEHKDKENSCYQEKMKEYLVKIEEREKARKNRKQSYKNNLKSMKAEFESLIAIKNEKIRVTFAAECELQNKLKDMTAECEMYKNEISKLTEINENSDRSILTGEGQTREMLDNKNEFNSRLSAHELHLNAAIKELDTVANLLKECEHLRKTNHESVALIHTLENKIGYCSERISNLVGGEGMRNFTQQSLEFQEKHEEDQKRRLSKVEKDLKKKETDWDTKIHQVKEELKEQKSTVESLKEQLTKSEYAYENFKNNFSAFADQNETGAKKLEEAEAEVQNIKEKLIATEEVTAQMKLNLEKTKQVQEELMNNYKNATGELEEQAQSKNKLLEYVAKVEEDNNGLKKNLENNLNCMKENEEKHRNEIKKKDEEINSLRRELRNRKKELELLGQEYQKLSEEMINMKTAHSRTLKGLLKQTRLIDEISGSQEYQCIKSKKLQQEADEKEEELVTLRKKLMRYEQEITHIKGLFDFERELRRQIEADVKKIKIIYEDKIKKRNIAVENKEKVQTGMQQKLSRQQHQLDVQRNSLEDSKVELEKKKWIIESYEKEIKTQKELVSSITQKNQEMERNLTQKCEQNSELEKRLQERANSMEQMARLIEQYKGIVACKESNIESMEAVLHEKDLKHTELQQNLISRAKECSKVEKEMLALQKRASELEESLRRADKMYKARCSEKRELGERLKNMKYEYRKLIEEKEEVEEVKHELELRLLQCGEGKTYTGKTWNIHLKDTKHPNYTKKKFGSAKVKPHSKANKTISKEEKAVKNELHQFGTEQDLADFFITLYDEAAITLNGNGCAFQFKQTDTQDDELAAIFGPNEDQSQN